MYMDDEERFSACAEVATTCLCFNLRRATRMVTQLFDAILRPSGLRITQFSLMVGISLRGPASIQDLAGMLGMDRTTLTRNLRGLEDKGLVSASRGLDRRSRLVSLTSEGQQALDETMPLWREAQEQAAAVLGEKRLGGLMPVLNYLSGGLQEGLPVTR
jgi:DNA-binding MarR family transcriptional regulator